MTREIEDAIEEYARNGVEIRKISIVGYSLGGSAKLIILSTYLEFPH